MEKSLPTEVNMTEFRDNLSAYLDAAERGKTITITRRGKPSAKLAAAEPVPEAIDLNELQAFRDSLDVRVADSVTLRGRQEERF